MTSLQDMSDDRGIPLDRVGVTGLVQMVTEATHQGERTAPARFDLSVALPGDARGVHLSRFARVLSQETVKVSPAGLRSLLERLRAGLEATEAFAEVEYDLLVSKKAPVSGRESLMACPVHIAASLGEDYSYSLGVTVPVMTVCPCSQEATDGTGHSQRTRVEIAVAFDGRVLPHELVELAESCASAPVYPLLTGEDEQHVIESAALRPVFVEDVVRGIAERLEADVRIGWYRVEAESLESVSPHNVYASVERAIA